MANKPLKAVLIGAGERGAKSYAPFALRHPDRLQFVAVAEPNAARREAFSLQHGIPRELQFEDWPQLLEHEQLGEVALVCTQDWQHTRPAIAAMRAGYHVLLEKPMANVAQECRDLLQVSRETQRQLHICHVLRYTPHFQKMRELVQSGVLGQIVNVDQRENAAFWHMAHSFVRGNWRNKEQSSPMILAKCCHDFDILNWVLDDSPVRLSSFGELSHFKVENAPPGAPLRCLDGCPVAETCPFYAPFIYQGMVPFWNSLADTARGFPRWAAATYATNPGLIRALSGFVPVLHQLTRYDGWPLSVLAEDPTPEKIDLALREGPYGRCVYHCDNDVVDHQVVLMQMESGTDVSLTMHGLSHNEYRTTRIEGSHGRLMAEFGTGGSRIVVDEHRTDWHMEYDTSADLRDGHGGGDLRLMAYLVDCVNDGDFEEIYADTQAALKSHLLAFAAEDSRLESRVMSREHWE